MERTGPLKSADPVEILDLLPFELDRVIDMNFSTNSLNINKSFY